MLKVLPLRRANPGVVLEKAAFDRDGRVIAEAGNELTEDRLRQLKNLGVRKIVVSDTIVQWLPKEDAESYSGEITIIETREFEEAAGEIVDSLQSEDSVEQLRQIALYLRQQSSRAGDAGGVTQMDDLIDRSYELEEQIEDLTDRLEKVEDEAVSEKIMDALEGKIRRIDEMVMEISSSQTIVKETVDVVGEKEDMRSTLSDFVIDNPEILKAKSEESTPMSPQIEADEDDWSDSVRTIVQDDVLQGIDEFIATAKNQGINSQLIDQLKELEEKISSQTEEKEELTKKLSEFDLDLDQHQKILDVLNGREKLQKSELLDLPISQQFASKTYDLMQKELDTRYRLWEAAEEAMEKDLSEFISKTDFLRESRSDVVKSTDDESDDSTARGDLSDEELYDVLDNLEEAEDLHKGVRSTARILEKSEGVDNKTASEFRILAESIEDVEVHINKLKERVHDEVNDDITRQTVFDVMEGNRPFNVQEFLELKAPMGLLEDVADSLTKRSSQHESLWKKLNSLTDYGLRSDKDTHGPKHIDDKVEEVTRRLSLKGYEDTSPVSSEKVDETGYEQPLLGLIKTGDSFEISNETGLDRSIVEDAKMCLKLPQNLESDQKFYFEPLKNETRKIFYGRELEEDYVLESARDLADVMVDHSQPLDMLLKPPPGGRYILSHAINTCVITLALANSFNFDDQEILDLTVAGLSMDLGMIKIPTGLWARSEELTQRGDKEVKQHPELSRNILGEAVNGDHQIQDLVHQHHERADGSGYPQGLESGEQHPLANIVGVCDAYVAMLEKRAYREAMSPDAAMMTLLRNKDEFDKNVVKALVENIGVYPNGSVVLLSDVRLALVKSQKPEYPTQPDILIISDRDQNRLDSPVPTNTREEDASVEEIVKW